MKLKTLATYILLVIAVGHLWAAQISFTAGNPALAADVNANFTELYNAKWTRTGADLGYTAGNVGIGTLTPGSYRLMVKSGGTNTAPLRLENSANTNDLFRIVQDTANQGLLQLYGADGVQDVQFFTDGGASFINSGNFGIGNAGPGAKLHLTQSAAGLAGGIRLTDGASSLNIYGSGDGHFHLNAASGTSHLVIADTGGNVGIGAPNPNGRLDVRDTALGDGGVVAYFGEDMGGMKIRRLNVGADPDRIGFSLQQAGTDYFFWIGLDGNLHTQASLPGSANGGTIVGDQTSTRSSKQDILPFQDIDNALAKILTAKLHRFRYKNEVIGYKEQAKYHIGFIADEVSADFMDAFGNSIDQVSVNGMLIASVQRLNQKIESRDAKIMTLEAELAKRDARLARLEKMESRLAQLETSIVRVAKRVEGSTVARR